jgi:chromosome segregation ATPase
LLYTRQNLLKSAEQAKAQARDSSRIALSEAALRADLNSLSNKHDEALAQAETANRKLTLVSEELRTVKAKLSRVTQEKIKLERDQRATLSLSKSLDNHSTLDSEYYKRKVSELQNHVQGLNAVIAEKNRHLDEMQRQLERNMTQNQLRSNDPVSKKLRLS